MEHNNRTIISNWKGKKEDAQIEINKYTVAAWNLTYTALWMDNSFSSMEVEFAQQFIMQFISRSTDNYREYQVYCQRIAMVHSYINKNDGKYIPPPTIWFDAANESGFYGTEKWMTNLAKKRKSLPLFKIEYKALAEGILEMIEEPVMSNFNYWKAYFLERGHNDIYQLFASSTIAVIINK
jgi:hypothetical protein